MFFPILKDSEKQIWELKLSYFFREDEKDGFFFPKKWIFLSLGNCITFKTGSSLPNSQR